MNLNTNMGRKRRTGDRMCVYYGGTVDKRYVFCEI